MSGGMKKGKTISTGWEKGFQDLGYLLEPPNGYSSVRDVSKKLGISRDSAKHGLLKLYNSGKVDRVKVKKSDGTLCYYYKD